ncbi:MAG: GAF domain-containing sensor histidine kinase [Deltaproteobacteria bacterium]|nr:GAF domain-containing sensor histidine kinase [Deltaproteobacteria bacterium]
MDTILAKVVEYSLRLTRAERGFLFMKDGTDHLKVRVALDAKGRDILRDPIRVSSGVVSAMLAHGIPIFLEDVKLNDMFARRQSIMESGVQFIMGIPLKIKGRILGFVYVDNTKSTRKFQKRDRQILTSFADQAALALENARLSHEKTEVEHDAAIGQMCEHLRETVRDCIGRLEEGRKLLASGGGGELVDRVDGLIAGAVRDLERRDLECQEYREFVAEQIQVRLEPALLDDVVSGVLDGLASRIEENSIQLHVSLNIGRSTMVDPGRMARALESIIFNAIEALGDVQDPLIAVTTAPVPEGLLVEVRDNGGGMTAALIERIFDPFYTTRGTGSPGLGLSIAKRIVELHRGHIEIKSKEGEGTNVWIVLPSDLRQSLIPRARKSTNPPPARHA